jgi:SAM-dependent methyltransferase
VVATSASALEQAAPANRPRTTGRLAARAFRAVVRDPASQQARRALDLDRIFDEGWRSTARFFARFPTLAIDGRSFLDFGCGMGATSIWLSSQGASRSVGIDIQSVEYPNRRLLQDFPEHRDRVEFRQVSPGDQPGEERFDVVISKDTFEHVADPDAYVASMLAFLEPGGKLVVGFGPLWKSPWGGHINYMTRLPWAHLIFPEEVILEERRRFRPDEQPAPTRFEEIRGGLNQMTLARFLSTMRRSGLRCSYLATNRGDEARSARRRAFIGAMRLGARVPPLREYCTLNLYSIWTRA